MKKKSSLVPLLTRVPGAAEPCLRPCPLPLRIYLNRQIYFLHFGLICLHCFYEWNCILVKLYGISKITPIYNINADSHLVDRVHLLEVCDPSTQSSFQTTWVLFRLSFSTCNCEVVYGITQVPTLTTFTISSCQEKALVDSCDKYLVVDTIVADGYLWEGLMLESLQRFDRAMDSYSKALVRDPNHPCVLKAYYCCFMQEVSWKCRTPNFSRPSIFQKLTEYALLQIDNSCSLGL